MRYLSNGDFGFPFTWPLFQAKQFYMWSYQTGAVNADGVMRMPGRLIDLVVFVLFGNLTFEYFFIASSLVIAFWSFYYFAYKFLNVQSIYTRLFGALFFTLNPIFLGNLSKIGLVLAASMLPLCLVMVREVFEQRRFRYLFLWLVALNVSLIHPFTFAANAAVSGCYLLYQSWLHRDFVLKNWHKFVLAAGAFLLLNAYFLLPLASMHTVSKNVLSDTISSTPTDYSALVDVLNTGDIFTGLSLSKNVVKDYNFYDAGYGSIYFLGAFGFYALLIVLYLRVERRMDLADKRRAALLLGCFLVLVGLATVTFLHIDTLIRLLINTPGGWAFRSPLKWQLYIPLAIFGLFVLFMKYVTTRRRRAVVYAALALTFVCMNGFLVADICKKLLTPRTIGTFGALQQLDLDHRNMLLVNGSRCWDYEQDHPRIMTELNQVLGSKNVQVKRVSVADIDLIQLGSYDYLLSCQGIMQPFVADAYQFKRTDTFAGNAFQLYANQAPPAYVHAAANMFEVGDAAAPANKYDFVTQQLGRRFNIANTPVPAHVPVTQLHEAYDDLSADDIRGGSITASLPVQQAAGQDLYVRQRKQPLFYNLSAGRLALTTVQQPGYLPVSGAALAIPPSRNTQLTVSYTDPAYTYKNLIPNASLERGLWQKQVGDCYDYDDQPELGMSLNPRYKTAGRQSLQLESANHIACTGPGAIPVTAGQQYLLSFDYWDTHGNGGYSIGFDDAGQQTFDGRLPDADGGWRTFTKVVMVPAGAHNLQLRVEAYPDSAVQGRGVLRFDNFKLLAVPDVQGSFYVMSQPPADLQVPAKVSYKAINPAHTDVQVRGARTPFYLVTTETYSPQWELALRGAPTVPAHLKLNGSANGWYIDPAALCRQAGDGCRQTAGGYDLDLTMAFTPQRWLYTGTVISAATLTVGTSYFVYDLRRDRRKGVKYRLWR